MKHKLVAGFTVACLLVTLGVFSVGGVYAFQATDTPTSTITAVGAYVPTINSTQQLNLDCNSGTPLAWGSLTPDSVWSVLCSHCMSTVIPSSTVVPTITPTLGIGTPSVTPSPTVTATATVTGGCSGVSLGAVTVEFPVFGMPVEAEFTYSVSCFVNGSNAIVCDGEAHAFDTTLNSIPENEAIVLVSFTGIPAGTTAYFDSSDTLDRTDNNYVDVLTPGIRDGCTANMGVGVPVSGSCTVTGTNIPMQFAWRLIVGGASSGVVESSWSWHTVWSFTNNCTGSDAPTPSPTPGTAPGYCTVVNGGGEIPDSGFEFNGITFGATACFDIGPIPTWDFGFLVVNVNIPWIAHLCLTNIDLGVIQAFGVSVSLLTISYVWGIAWAIRNLFTS